MPAEGTSPISVRIDKGWENLLPCGNRLLNFKGPVSISFFQTL